MKNMKWMILILALTASVTFAQTAASKKASAKGTTPFTKKSAATAKAVTPKTSAPKTASKTTAPKTTLPKAASRATTTAAVPKTAKPKAVKKTKPAAAPQAPETASTAAVPSPGRKRDPFVSPVQARLEGMQVACSGGARCLAVNEIVLRGVVKSPNGMIAVVENAAQKTYFLHENQPIYNGFVERITPDSVIFKEHYLDNLGHDSQREIVKTVNAPVV